MAEKLDRDDDEAAIAGGLSLLFADTRNTIEDGQRVNWADFQRDATKVMQDPLEDVFAVVFLLLLIGDGDRADARFWAASQSRIVAAQLATNLRTQLSSGADPAMVLAGSRAESLAATEVTRAISTGELTARRRNAEAGTGQRPGDDPQTARTRQAGERDEVPDGLAIRDGLVAVWQTEKDERVCPICQPLHKKQESVWVANFPLGPPAHPNCRCWLEYVPRGTDRA